MVCHRQGTERDLLVTRIGHYLDHGVADIRRAALTHRPVPAPRQAETAAARAAPCYLQHGPVVHRLHGGYHRLKRQLLPLQHRHHRARHRRRPGRHEYAFDSGQLLQFILTGPVPGLFTDMEHLRHHHLTITDDDEIEKGRHRMRVAGAGPPGEHQRVVLATVLPAQRHTGKIQHLQDIGIGKLVLQGDPPQIHPPYRLPALQHEQRYILVAHQRGHVGPGAVDPLRPGFAVVVDQGVKDLDRLVGDADLIDIGVAERYPECIFLLPDTANLAADIAGRLFHPFQEGFNSCFKSL
ncbi:hypothetical protein BMS3Abin01_00619 [bacterium BMS3Abin01]|nr:hypothetical protein BMS3Abin01_00619 [bacterium BMS3Abin01]